MGDGNFKEYHEFYGLRQCIVCFGPLGNHHYYCNRCWAKNKLSWLCDSLDKEFMKVKEQMEAK